MSVQIKNTLFLITIMVHTNSYSMFASLFDSTPTKPTVAAHGKATQQQMQNKEMVQTKTNAQVAAPVSAPQTQTINQTSPVIVNVNNILSQTDNKDVINNNAASANQHVDQQSYQYVHQHVMQQTIAMLKHATDQAHEQFTALGDWIKMNKFKLVAVSACSGYCALAAYLLHTQYRLQDETLWAHWRSEDSYEALMAIPQKKLAQDLVFAIQRRYTTDKQFTDFIQPLTYFMQDIEREKKMLKQYITITKWINFIRLQRIFPINEKKINRAKKMLQRVIFVEHIFLSWAAEFKMTQNAA